MSVEAVFFDLYETLITEVHKDPALTPPASVILGIDEDVFKREWRARVRRRMIGDLPDYPTVLREICASAGRSVDADLIEQLHTRRVASQCRLYADMDRSVVHLLDDIRRAGIKIGLISNASADEIGAFHTSPIAGAFDSVVFSCQVGCTKPDPLIYLTACDRLAVKPDRAIFVGDGSSNELAGAAAVGMTPYQAMWFVRQWPDDVQSRHAASLDREYAVLTSPADLSAILRGDL